MPDITMCASDNCTQKDTCYRYTAKPSVLQSYANFLRYVSTEGDCLNYIYDADSEGEQ